MAFSVSVPFAPGVPSVFRSSLGDSIVSLLAADSYALISGAFGFPGWGLYFAGLPVVVADTISAFDLNKNWTLSDFPVEGGAFESYNKVYVPFRGTFRFVTGGSESDKQKLLLSIDAISGDLNSYDTVTPEAVYSGVNVTSYTYKRTAVNGVGLLQVDVVVEEVRPSPSVSYSDTTSPTSAAQLNGGTVQPAPATTAQVFATGGGLR